MKPDQELERALRSGSPKERDALAKEAPLDVLIPALESIVRRQNRKLFWIGVVNFPCAFIASGRFLRTIFEQIAKWGNVDVNITPFWGIVLYSLFTLGIFGAMQSTARGQEAFGASIRGRASILLGLLAGRATRQEVGRLCAIYWRTRGSGWITRVWVQERHIVPLLLALDDDEARKLPDDAKRWIRWRLKRGASPEFRVAALLTLSSGGDRKLAPVARGLVEDADERVRVAASEALKILENRP